MTEVHEYFPYAEFPSGWYQVAWAGEIEPGAAVPLRYFATDLVACRTETGSVAVFDAYCPHLGAHLGYGGKVCGDDLICPFHGWQWDMDGHNTAIPYSTKPNRGKRLNAWPVREVNGLVLVWYDALGRDPSWEPPTVAEYGAPDRYQPYPECTRLWATRRLRPQVIAENSVDPAHQKYIHGAADVPDIIDFSAQGPMFHTRQRLVYGKGKDTTWLTPDGEIVAYIDAQIWGMGMAVARFEGTDDSVHLQCQTPVEHDTADVRVTVLVSKEPGHPDTPSGQALKRLQFQWRQVENDMVIWEHMRYEDRPPLPPEEAKPYLALRRWAADFYPITAASGATDPPNA